MDDAKKKILARRAQFVAAALAGLAGSACGKSTADKPVIPEVDAAQIGPPLPPAPCLTIAPPQPLPQPCLSARREPPPPPGCDPPYWYDAEGVKHFKIDCVPK